MATGGDEFAYEVPKLDKNFDNDDDEEEVNRTQPFEPDVASTPYHRGEQMEMRPMQHGQT